MNRGAALMKQSYPEIFVNGEAGETGGAAVVTDLPARTVVDFSRARIASRLLIGLVILGGGVGYLAWDLSRARGTNVFSFAGGGLLALLGTWFTVVSLYHLFVRRPVLTIDAEGLAFLGHQPIAWRDVRSVQVRVLGSGGGRPVSLLRVTPETDRARFEVEITQTTAEPEQLARALESYIAAYRDRSGLPSEPRR